MTDMARAKDQVSIADGQITLYRRDFPAPLKLSHYWVAKGGILDGSKAAFGLRLPEDLAAGGIGLGRWG